MKYEDKLRPGKCKVKTLTLAHLKKEGTDADRVVDDLFKCHPKYFNKKYTSKETVREFITKIIEFHRVKRNQTKAKETNRGRSRNQQNCKEGE